MRFFFHVRSDELDDPDLDGIDLPSLDVAVREAKITAHEIAMEMLLGNERVGGMRFEIADGTGRILATVGFSDALRLN
jgi:hypothetical protein